MRGYRIFGFRCYRITDGLNKRHGRHCEPMSYRRLELTLTLGWQQLRRR